MVQLAMSSEAPADSVSQEEARALLREVLQLLGRNQQVDIDMHRRRSM